MENKKHYFYAVKIPEYNKKYLNQWIEENIDRSLFEKWVHPLDFHITLAFLGYAQKNDLYKLTDEIRYSLIKTSGFPLTISHFGTFGKPNNPRIFWAGVYDSQHLYEIQNTVFDHCMRAGFQLDQKPFRPHITVARKFKGVEPFKLSNIRSLAEETESWRTFIVSEIVLYQTNLHQTPKYEEIEKIQLQL